MDIQKVLLKNTSIASLALQNIPPKLLLKLGKNKAERNFKKSLKIQAYKDFLEKESKKHNFEITLEDVPVTDKKNYIKQYPLDQLAAEPIVNNYTIEQSSGFSGEPFFWLRYKDQDANFINYLKLGLVKMFDIDKKSTLLINTFALGTWVTGVKLSRSLAGLSNLKGLKTTAVSTGTNKADIIKVLETFESYYDQIVIFGYPPFISDLIETIVTNKTVKNLTKLNFVVGGEGFPEEWRDYLAEVMGYSIEKHPDKILSAFGSADTGLEIGYEHPITVIFRRLLRDNPKLRTEVLKEELDYTPHFFQFNPLNIWIEEHNKELLFTSYGGIPINKYNLHDKGGILQYDQVIEILSRYYDINNLKKTLKPFHMPIVYLYGRSDGTISIDGENFYLQDIQGILNRYSEIKSLINKKLDNITEILKLIPSNKIANNILEFKDHILNVSSKINIINSFKLKENSHRLEIYIELDSKIYMNEDQLKLANYSFYKAFTILFFKYLHSYKTLVNENLKSADMKIYVNNYSEGIFADSQNRIKLNYKFKA